MADKGLGFVVPKEYRELDKWQPRVCNFLMSLDPARKAMADTPSNSTFGPFGISGPVAVLDDDIVHDPLTSATLPRP